MQENGFAVQREDVENLGAVKVQYQIPQHLQSCHTAVVDGYVIEGHVPAAEVERLLAERPDIAGLSVPGMPVGSPGMESPGAADQPYDVIAFDATGNTSVFASYRP
ncbi:MAG: CopG family transcriptional regulator [Ardenticatenaceae bacterium]|nr:CopG family transcriptional regulator [Ardenticatenaceae bacterium]